MKTPKLLPWYARKAGVPIDRAEILWRRAVRAATDETGWVGNSEYWGAAMDHFQRLLRQERASLCAPRIAPVVRWHKRIWAAPLETMSDVATMTMRRWHHYFTQRQRAA